MWKEIIDIGTFILTVIGVVIAAVGVFYAVRSLRAAVDTLELALKQSREDAKIVQAQFWVLLRGVFAHYDDVHANFRPKGKGGSPDYVTPAEKGPDTAEEWARVEVYMGLFEFCEKMLERGQLNEKDFRGAYEYRVGNIATNKVILREKLLHEELKTRWEDFRNLCKKWDLLPKDA